MGPHLLTLINFNQQNSDDIEIPSSSAPTVDEVVSPVNEIKYIVFKSSLLQPFTLCTSCYNTTTGEVTYTKGTFIAVRQQCSHCGKERVWTSQPHIKDTPAGNILLSASSGTTPTKILRVLTHMKISFFTDRTFYHHQKRYLGPATISVWEAKQSMLLSQCKATGIALTIVGDGRADSPGHSAKYGSYGIIDLATNKVIHVELVQVTSYNKI